MFANMRRIQQPNLIKQPSAQTHAELQKEHIFHTSECSVFLDFHFFIGAIINQPVVHSAKMQFSAKAAALLGLFGLLEI